jgi:hypothetical protein
VATGSVDRDRTGAISAVHVWLPIDAKFPKEDYEKLLAARGVTRNSSISTRAGRIKPMPATSPKNTARR